MSRRLITLLILTGLVVVTGVFAVGFTFGRFSPAFASFAPDSSVSNFWQVKELVKDRYVTGVNDRDLVIGATKGLVESTGDPYSEFLTKEEAQDLDSALSGTVEGIGVEIGDKDGQVTVIAPRPDTPAARAGIVAGDAIISVNNEPTAGKSIDQVAKQVRGPKGTQVTIEVKGEAQPVSRTLTITRDMVQDPSVALTYQGDVAVIALSRFGDDTKAGMERAIADIQTRRPRGIILDMRSNPGGYLDSAVEVTSVFLTSGEVVKEQFARGRTETRSVTRDARLAAYPLVVLVDKGSASAAEITAGALRDDRAVPFVGEKTYGKGSVQELEKLQGGAVLKLTVAEWLTPKGLSISKQGLTPDVDTTGQTPEQELQTAIATLR